LNKKKERMSPGTGMPDHLPEKKLNFKNEHTQLQTILFSWCGRHWYERSGKIF